MITQELLSFVAVFDLMLFGPLFVLMIPLSLVAFNGFVVACSVIYGIYTGVLGIYCLKKIPRWCRSKKGVKKILYWMCARITVFLWTTLCFLIMFITLCSRLSTGDESFKIQGYVGLAILIPIAGFLGFQIYSVVTLLWAVKSHIFSPKQRKSSHLNTQPPAVMILAANSNSPTKRDRKESRTETDHVLMGSTLQSRNLHPEDFGQKDDDNHSRKSLNTVASSKKFGVKLNGPNKSSKNKVHPMVGVPLGEGKKPNRPGVPASIFETKKS